MMPKAPCKDCKERTAVPNCHITCQKYIKFSKEQEEKREAERAYKIQHYGKYNLYYR